MIKHGKIYPADARGRSHLGPIEKFVTKGIADSKESIVLHPKACDVKGAKPFNGQQCVIAKALQRTLHPQAVAIGRSLAYAVFGGLAIRFQVPKDSRELVEEFDRTGKARSAPVRLLAVNPAWLLRSRPTPSRGKKDGSRSGSRSKQHGVRAVGGGMTMAA